MKKISFDFDGTLVDDFYGEHNAKKEDIQKLCKWYIDNGYEVYIVTKRFGEEYKDKGKTNEHVEVYELAEKLGIPKERVFFTNRHWKHEKLDKLGINLHFENSRPEVYAIKIHTPHINVAYIEDPDFLAENLKY